MVRIEYVDGRAQEAPASAWPDLPSEGVDSVAITNAAGSTRVAGHSVYWLYREGWAWVLGGGSVGYTNPLGETLVGEGDHRYRELDYMPDLPHSAVKLGHWLPGKDRPPHA